MVGWPSVNRHDRFLLGERGSNLPRRVAVGTLAFGKNSCGHVVLHHGAFLQLVSDKVHMIWAGCFEKLFEVISELPRLALRIALSSGDKLHVKFASVLVVVTLIIACGDCDSLWSPLRPPLVASSTAPCTLVGCLGWHPPTAARGRLGATLQENSPVRFVARGMPAGDVEEFICGLWIVTVKLVYQGLVVCARPEQRDDIDVLDLGEFVTLSGEAPDLIP
jgi:hypothetical protein